MLTTRTRGHKGVNHKDTETQGFFVFLVALSLVHMGPSWCFAVHVPILLGALVSLRFTYPFFLVPWCLCGSRTHSSWCLGVFVVQTRILLGALVSLWFKHEFFLVSWCLGVFVVHVPILLGVLVSLWFLHAFLGALVPLWFKQVLLCGCQRRTFRITLLPSGSR